MTVTKFPLIAKCRAAVGANPEFQQPNDPTLTVQLETQDGQIFLLPLSEPATSLLWEVVSNWRQARDFLLAKEPPEPGKLQ
jgi:hypothetical protein